MIITNKKVIFELLAGLISLFMKAINVKKRLALTNEYSIGIFLGNSIVGLSNIKNLNPVITAEDITDVDADFVADPFMIKVHGCWHMFFEIFNRRSNHGEIGYAYSENGFDWKYRNVVIAEPFHLAYPYVFEFNDEIYMILDSSEAGSVRLYRSDEFPMSWKYESTLLKGIYNDSSIFHVNNTWWMISLRDKNYLELFYTDNLSDPMKAHPKNPIKQKDPRRLRSGGRVLVYQDEIIRFVQDCYPFYGGKIRVFKITEVSKYSYNEVEIKFRPKIRPHLFGWNAKGMHHVDPHPIAENRWIACVDGIRAKVMLDQKELKILSIFYNLIAGSLNIFP